MVVEEITADLTINNSIMTNNAVRAFKCGKIVMITFWGATFDTLAGDIGAAELISNAPAAAYNSTAHLAGGGDYTRNIFGNVYTNGRTSTIIKVYVSSLAQTRGLYGTLIYLCA